MDTEIRTYSALAQTLRHYSGMIMKTSKREIAQFLEEEGIELHPHQFLVLQCLRKHTMTLVEVSRMMELDPSTVAPTIEMFVRQGWVKRDRDPNDRRRAPLTVTQEGLEPLKLIKSHFEERGLLVKSLELMGEEKSQELISLLQEVVTTMATQTSETTEEKDLCENRKTGKLGSLGR